MREVLSFIRFVATEAESRRQRSAQLADLVECVLPPLIPPDFEFPRTRDADLDLIALLQPSAFTTAAGRRTARLFPHFAIRMVPLL